MDISETGKILYSESKRIINEAKSNGQLVLFVGSGASVESGMPLWKDAVEKIAEKLPLTDNQNDILKIPQYYYNTRGKKEYTQLIRDIFRYEDNLVPTKLHKKILEFQTDTIVTTNYDHLIERAAEENGEFIRVISQDIDMPYRKSKRELIKLHGDFEHDNFVLKEDDYLNYSRNFKLIETYTKSLIGSKVILFIGYSLNDPDIKQIIAWVKDVLKEDFQRAYLILTIATPNSIEREYFKNLGINLIYASELVEQTELTHTQQLTMVLEYLLDKEQGNALDLLYNEIRPLQELNYVYGKYIENAFRKSGIKCEGNTIWGMMDNEGDNPLFEAIWVVLENRKNNSICDRKKVESIIQVCEKSRFSEVIKYKGHQCVKQSINNIERTHLEKMIYLFDYAGLRGGLESNNSKMSPDTPELYMQQAFICAFFYEYSRAYNYLKLASRAYYSRKSYAWYFIAEFNRKYVGEVASSPVNTHISSAEKNVLKSEVNALDLDRILNSIPDIGNDSNTFLKDLKNFTIAYTLFYDVYAKSLKTSEQASTRYSLFAGTAAYESLRTKISDFDRYETNNYIILDRFTENKSIFDLYIRTILSSVNAKDITDESEGELIGNIKPDSLTAFDLYVILRYMNQKEMKNLFEEYGIKILPLSKEGETYLFDVCNSICNEDAYQKLSVFETDRFWIYLELLGHVQIIADIAWNVFERFNRINSDFEIRSYRSSINSFIKNICNQKLFENIKLCELAKLFAEKIVRLIIGDKAITKHVFTVLYNLLYFIHEGGHSFDNLQQIKLLVSEKQNEILFEIYPFLGEVAKEAVNEEYAMWSPKENDAEEYYQYCNAILTGVKKPDKDIEESILKWISSEYNSERKEKNNVPFRQAVNHTDVLRQLINLFLGNKIFDIDRLRIITENTSDELAKWLLDLDKFDYRKFDYSWLLLCADNLLETIAKNENARRNIVLIYKEQYEAMEGREEIHNIIVKYFIK